MSYDIGINFRETSGFVTDTASTTYSLSEAYPTTRGSVTFGFGTTDLLTFCRDRDSGIDTRLAGLTAVNSAAVADQTFRLDVPASGLVAVSLAMGDATFGSDSSWQILDSDGTTVLASQTGQTTAGGEWRDATGVLHASASDWTTNNAAVNVTLSGTIFYLKLIATAGVTKISHLRLYQASSGATVSTITGTTATEASSVVFTATMSGTGGGTFAYSWSGTATSADYTTTLTTGMCAVTGGSGSVTVSGSNITVDSTVTAFTVTVPTTTDTLDEANETIRLVIGGVTSSSGTINDDDAAPTITGTASQTVTAGSPVVITYSPGLSGQTRTYTLALTDGTAAGGTDYDNSIVSGDFAVTAGTGSVSISGSTVTVDAGVTEFTLTITTT